MSDINIRRAHALPLAHARKQAEAMAATLEEKFDLASRWDGDVLRFERSGVAGSLTVSRSEVHLVARLGMLLAFMKPQIEQHIHGELDRIFAATGAPAKAAGTATVKSAAGTSRPAKKTAPRK